MMMKSLTEMVKDNKKATFQYYRDRELWYKTDCGFEFPVPAKDVGTGIFKAEHKAIELMKWIRTHRDMLIVEKQKNESIKDVTYDGMEL
jgi:hypothetical protein